MSAVRLAPRTAIPDVDGYKKDTEEKRALGGRLKTYTYKEACANWWEKMREKDRQTVRSMPNFDKDIFFEITGIEV